MADTHAEQVEKIQQAREAIRAASKVIDDLADATGVDAKPEPVGHTPGPWWLHGPELSVYGGLKSQIVCRLHDAHGNAYGNWQANARLIAAAPELLEALRDLRSYLKLGISPSSHWRSLLESADAAVAKATGGDS